jgi:alkyl sulfatase BDS1-like metallo-beta-lactamase superfamily hydrolase
VYTRLGHGAENGPWRNFYLQGASELRHGVPELPPEVRSAELVAALSVEQVFDSIAIRIDGPRAWNEALAIDWVFTDLGETYRTELSNGVLNHEVGRAPGSGKEQPPDESAGPGGLRVTLTRARLSALLGGDLDGIELDGDAGLLGRLVACVDRTRTNFPIVTP